MVVSVLGSGSMGGDELGSDAQDDRLKETSDGHIGWTITAC